MKGARNKIKISLLIALFATVLSLAGKAILAAPESSSRSQADEAAKQEFLDEAVFFAKGEGMHQFPGVIDLYEAINGAQTWNNQKPVSDSNPWLKVLRSELPEDTGIQIVDGKFVGVYRLQKPGYSFGIAGCTLCHAGKAAGILIPGLGNKDVNLRKFAFWGLEVPENTSLLLDAPKNSPEYDQIKASSERMEKILSDSRYYSPVDGLIENNVVLKTFYDAFGVNYDEGPKHFLQKVPALWGIQTKREVGMFTDGGGDGSALGWTVGPEIMWGQKADVISSAKYTNKIHQTEAMLDAFLPPPYPFAINGSLAKMGADVFKHTCSGCHGNYDRDAQGLPIYEAPKLIPLSVVQTDPHRSELFANEAFWDAAKNSSFRNLIRKGPHYQEIGPSYFAPKLWGIWARFPYLHNASVPTLWHMLHPDQRPKIFSLRNAGERYRFDEEKVGLTTHEQDTLDYKVISVRADMDSTVIYSTSLEGQSSEGHPFGSDLSEDDKRALIEFLKTL